MVSIKTILIISAVLLSLILFYYFRVEITGFVSDAATIMLSISDTSEVNLRTYVNQTSYCPNERSKITNIIENVGIFDITGNLSTTVISPFGPAIFSKNWDNVDLAVDELKSFEFFLDFTSDNTTGRYNLQSYFNYENKIASASGYFTFKKGIGTLTASPPQIEKTIKKNESDAQTIIMWLKDACENTNVSLSVSSGNPGDWVNFSSNSVFLTPFILNTSIINITVPESAELGNYLGQITLTASGQTINIPLIIHIAPRDIEVNITVTSTEKTVCRGSIASAIVNITKINPPDELLMNVTYQIIDSNSVIVANSTESVLVNSTVIKNPGLSVPTSSSLGYYTYLVSVQYEEVTEQDTDVFEVINCETPTGGDGGGGGGGKPPAGGGAALNYSMSIDVSTDIISAMPGNKETMLVTVSNIGNVNLKLVKLSVEGIPSTWIKVLPSEVDIPYSRSQEYLVVINIPNNAASGKYDIKIKAISKIESETKIVKLIIGKTLEETANLMLEEMEKTRTTATRAILTEECIDISKITPLFDEAEKSREKGLNDYRSKNYENAIDWFKHSISSYNKVISQIDMKMEIKMDSLKSDSLGILPIIGIKKEINDMETYYQNKNYERFCTPVFEISRLKKLSIILWVLLLILIIVSVIIFLIIYKRKKGQNRKETMEKIRSRLGEFQPENIESNENENQ